MTANTAILHARARLIDENVKDYRISSAFLLELVFLHQNKLIAEFNQNIKTQSFRLDQKKEVPLQFEIIKIINAFLNKTELDIVSHSLSLKHKSSFTRLIMINPTHFHLSHARSGMLELIACKKAFLNDKDDELILNDSFLNALVYMIMIDALGIEDTTLNLQRINFYMQMLEREKSILRGLYSNLSSKTSFLSPYIKV